MIPIQVQEHALLFIWSDGKPLRARLYDLVVWKPALVAAGVLPPPGKDKRGRRQFKSDRSTGLHALRHYFASITLADGVNIKELSEYLGHCDPGFTLQMYTHMLPSSHERARTAMESRLSRLFSLKSHGAVTEQAVVRSPTTSWEPDDGRYPDQPQISV